MQPKRLIPLRIAAATLLVAGCAEGVGALTFTDKGHDGVVTDAVTGRPIEGVLVVAKWTARFDSHHSGGDRCVKALVARSDAAGRFELPGWRRSDDFVAGSFDFLVHAYRPGYALAEPRLLASRPKPGFGEKYLGAAADNTIPATDVRLELRPSNATPEQRAKELLEVMLDSRCDSFGKGAEYGTLYFVHNAVYEEALALPVEARAAAIGPKLGYLEFLRSRREEMRKRLVSEDPQYAGLRADPALAPISREIGIPSPTGPGRSAPSPRP